MGAFDVQFKDQREVRDTASMAALAVAPLVAILGCDPGGVGAPCIPEDEYSTSFQSFSASEVNVESRSFQCETRVCISNHFQGRVSCPYGQSQAEADGDPRCFVPGSQSAVRGAVAPQLVQRRADDAVYCSCRCDGPDPNARYCDCPSGFACQELVPELGIETQNELVGSYCVRDGTRYDPISTHPANECDSTQRNCE